MWLALACCVLLLPAAQASPQQEVVYVNGQEAFITTDGTTVPSPGPAHATIILATPSPAPVTITLEPGGSCLDTTVTQAGTGGTWTASVAARVTGEGCNLTLHVLQGDANGTVLDVLVPVQFVVAGQLHAAQTIASQWIPVLAGFVLAGWAQRRADLALALIGGAFLAFVAFTGPVPDGARVLLFVLAIAQLLLVAIRK